MGRSVLSWVCVFALGVVPLAGCGETSGGSGGSAGTGGAGGTGGTGRSVSLCEGTVCPCTEAGIRAGIVEGGGPYTFDCDGPSVVALEANIEIDRDVASEIDGNAAARGSEAAIALRLL